MSSVNNVDRFRQRLQQGKICVGTSVSLTDPIVSELAAEAGNDLVWIEMEHSYLDLRALLGHLAALRGTQAAPIVRVAWNDPVLIKPILDLAPAGIVVPMVCSGEEAAKAVGACRYPPQGVRGFGPIRNMYGIETMEEYLAIASEQIMVFVQIEHIQAVHNLDEILATPGLDGVVIGRNDLTGSMGKLGQHSDPKCSKPSTASSPGFVRPSSFWAPRSAATSKRSKTGMGRGFNGLPSVTTWSTFLRAPKPWPTRSTRWEKPIARISHRSRGVS